MPQETVLADLADLFPALPHRHVAAASLAAGGADLPQPGGPARCREAPFIAEASRPGPGPAIHAPAAALATGNRCRKRSLRARGRSRQPATHAGGGPGAAQLQSTDTPGIAGR